MLIDREGYKGKLKSREHGTVIYNEPKIAMTIHPKNCESANDPSPQISREVGISSGVIYYITVGNMKLLFEFYINMSLKSEPTDFCLCLHLLSVCWFACVSVPTLCYPNVPASVYVCASEKVFHIYL